MTRAWELIAAGGWLMVPLAICSVAALAIILERAWALRRGRVLHPDVLDLVSSTRSPSPGEALALCRRTPGAFARVIETLLAAHHRGQSHVLEAVNAAGRAQLIRLERGLVLLEIIAGIAPLLGLMGTVLGMVIVFEAISAEGLGDPQVLADGISRALVTTVAGLGVAIPALAFHSWFAKRVDDYADEMHEHAVGYLARIADALLVRAEPPVSGEAARAAHPLGRHEI